MAIFIILSVLAFLLFGPVGLVIILILALPVFLIRSCGKDIVKFCVFAQKNPKLALVALVLCGAFMVWLSNEPWKEETQPQQPTVVAEQQMTPEQLAAEKAAEAAIGSVDK